jgi:hypothetical protein
MIELLRSENPALISALKAALADVHIQVFEFDSAWADTYVGVTPRRLMVTDEDLQKARSVAREICPEELPPEPLPNA